MGRYKQGKLQGSRRQVARFVKESSAIGDEWPYIDDGCTYADDECADVGGGGTFLREPCKNIRRTMQKGMANLAENFCKCRKFFVLLSRNIPY